MSAYVIEVKSLNIPAHPQIGFPTTPNHAHNNLAGTATSSWAEALAASTLASSPHPYSLVVSNLGTTAIQIALSADASPARYHVVLGGSQRQIDYPRELPIQVKTA